jgi:hypothetical protein
MVRKIDYGIIGQHRVFLRTTVTLPLSSHSYA